MSEHGSKLKDLVMVNAPFVDELYQDWLADPTGVDPAWHAYFSSIQGQIDDSLKSGGTFGVPQGAVAAGAVVPSQAEAGKGGVVSSKGFPTANKGGQVFASNVADLEQARDLAGLDADEQEIASSNSFKQSRVTSMIWAYRDIGYLYADLNPLKGYMTLDMYYRMFSVEGDYDTLSLKEYGLEESDLDHEFYAGRYLQPAVMPLRRIIERLRAIYCGPLGTEVMHIQNKVARRWLFDHLEGSRSLPPWSQEQKILFQKDLIRAESFEQFIHANFVGQKRFSLEGGEVLIPALHYLISQSARSGIAEIVIGMAHRGRLNVFVNSLGRPAVDIFAKFEDHYKPHDFGGNGDVKYHLGFSSDYLDEQTGRSIHLSLVANPSHLEAVDPVVEGKARAQQRRRGDKNRKKVLPILIHGDAAFSGQGVVAETLNLSQLKGYRTGGTVHIIVNNQIGFTTASRDARSTFFATDIAKSINVPIFHVNGDDPEAVAKSIHLALQYRQKFGMDVVVDIICYRRLGHNETDEPSFTHPRMYSLIKDQPSTPSIYGKKLVEEGVWSKEEQEKFLGSYKESLQDDLKKARSGYIPKVNDGYAEGEWKGLKKDYSFGPFDTTTSMETLTHVAKTLTTVPADFTIHPKLQKIIQDREKQFFQDKTADWGLGESLAFGSLLMEGHAVRLSGEDCQRGTFSHRHANWWDIGVTEPRNHMPLQHLSPNQGVCAIYDSPLSEFAVLGFEYGYSITMPNYLIMWEAQFGDFSNGAQVIIDQFILAGETKWFRSSGLVMLLPHGYEGQGPEHSSAHLDRFLSRCGEDNIQVAFPTNPAQIFHLLRKQMKQPFRKPLVIMSPKSLLRHKGAVSTIDELANGRFHYVLDDPASNGSEEIIQLCTGKVYYDIVTERERRERKDVAVIRLEQLYPFPEAELKEVLAKYPKAKKVRWVQEENQNHGAWTFVFQRSPQIVAALHEGSPAFKAANAKDKNCPWGFLEYAGRPESASPATGSHKQHVEELAALMAKAFS